MEIFEEAVGTSRDILNAIYFGTHIIIIRVIIVLANKAQICDRKGVVSYLWLLVRTCSVDV